MGGVSIQRIPFAMKFLPQIACLLLCLLPAVVGLTNPPAGAKVVRQTGTQSGEYSTVSAAVASLSGTSSAVIFIYPGTYHEQVLINYGGPLTIYGYSTDGVSYKNNQVTITNNLNAQDNGGNDPCATVRAHSPDFKMYNVIVKNTLRVKDTMAAPSPATRTPSLPTAQAINTTATAISKERLTTSTAPPQHGLANAPLLRLAGGAVTANSRNSATDPGYYVIDSSVITSATSTSLTGKVYLGRPWRPLARVVFQRSTLPDLINVAGWTTLAANATPIFMEYGNTGAGANTAARKYETPSSAQITHAQVLGSDYSTWIDSSL
ncbi:hypothetical protein LshimejAT787_1004670 [Lyophyllum shimeji]|uniref:pectinesterase n=1 Tax=Lyophyllum shimeji TaxID=47721 RepID=A0A9P3PV56_LYOSH|nr:hypothetical protein LshimejAT787_1004670 [Lyophyllum shimeji]